MVRTVFTDENENDLEFFINGDNKLVISITNQGDISHICIENSDLQKLHEEFNLFINAVKNNQNE